MSFYLCILVNGNRTWVDLIALGDCSANPASPTGCNDKLMWRKTGDMFQWTNFMNVIINIAGVFEEPLPVALFLDPAGELSAVPFPFPLIALCQGNENRPSK